MSKLHIEYAFYVRRMICHSAGIDFLIQGAIALSLRKLALKLGVRMVLWCAGVAVVVREVGREYAADGYRYPRQARAIGVLHVVRCVHAPRHELSQRSCVLSLTQ